MDQNLKFLQGFGDISEASFRKLEKLETFRKIPANTLLAEAGTIQKNLYMLVSGVISAYVNSESGKHFSKRLFTPISFAGALTAILKNEPTKVNYITLTNCKIYELNFQDFKDLCRKEFGLQGSWDQILHNYLLVHS